MAVYIDPLFQWMIGEAATEQARRHSTRNAGKWSHMIADSESELDKFAVKIGLKKSYCQHRGTDRVHYDLTPGMRAMAVKFGAVEVTQGVFSEKRKEYRDKMAVRKLF